MKKTHFQILIIGAGTAGITVAARLLRKDSKLDIGLIDPASKHYYQAAWTLVGAGTYNFEKTARNMKDLIPSKASWIKESVLSVDPDTQSVVTDQHNTFTYDYLVACPGIQIDIDQLEGLKDCLGKDAVCSNYTDPNHTWEVIKNFKGGTALFTQPATTIKCGGAPQKIMYLADDYFRKSGVRDKTTIIFATPGTVIFGTEPFKSTLMKVVDRKNIHLRFFHKLDRIDGQNKKAYYTITASEEQKPKMIYNRQEIGEKWLSQTRVEIPFDMIHLAPPQSAPDFIKKSKLAAGEGPKKGFIDVNTNTLQHLHYPNVFAIGDAAGLPTAKTGAAIRKQAPVLVENLYHFIKNEKDFGKEYDGYSSCPIVTGYGKMLLAEFKYNNERASDPLITKFVDTSKEQYSMWLLKKYGLPFMYWNLMLKGLA